MSNIISTMESLVLKMRLQATLYLASMILSVTTPLSNPGFHPPTVFRRFGTKTSYAASVAIDSLSYSPYYGNDQTVLPPNCRPVQVVGLFRHGTRFPGDKDIIAATEVLERIKQLSASMHHSAEREKFIEGLSRSLEKYDIKACKELAGSGHTEHKGLGRRFYHRYSDLFSHSKSSEIKSSKKIPSGLKEGSSNTSPFLWYSSKKSRSIDSCKGFREGFFETGGRKVEGKIEERDDLLRFFDRCDRYVERVASNKTSRAEVKRFQELKFNEVVERVARVVGVEGLEISTGEMKAMYVLAGSEIAIYGTNNWEKLFTDQDLEILEYAADIKNYWKKGYGYPINYEQGCILLNHMFSHMDSIVQGIAEDHIPPTAVFYFGHTETIIPILTLLGLFNDSQPLVAGNFHNSSTRLFRTSRVSPFSSNMAFILHQCPAASADADHSQINDEDINKENHSPSSNTQIHYSQTMGAGDGQLYSYKLEVLFKEVPIRLPCCESTVCDYDVVRQYYMRYIDKCGFEEMCGQVTQVWSDRASVHEEL